MNKASKRVFISGASGVIGTALVNNLIDQGCIILAGDLKPCPPEWQNLPHLTYRQGDLLEMSAHEIEGFAPDAFYHLAATFERSEETAGFWEENFHHNVHLSHHLMTLVKDLPSLKKVIFASSYLLYDPQLYLFPAPQAYAEALSEKTHIKPRNLCGSAKWMHEQELAFIKNFYPHLQIICARIFRSYGKNSRDIISRWVRALLKNEEITVYSPEGRFDFVYAEDVAGALIQLAESSFSGAVNLGSGQSHTIQDILDILKTHFGDFPSILLDSNTLYESSEADMQLYSSIALSHFFQTPEQAIPKIIAFEKSKNSLVTYE